MSFFCTTTDLPNKIQTNIKALLIDIEGTTTPISFVTEVLFPYVKDNVKSYLNDNWDSKEVQVDIEALRAQASEDIALEITDVPKIASSKDSKALVVESAVQNVHWQMSQDRKITALKQLQGHMWRSAYKSGSILGDVYEDVRTVMETLKDDGKELYIYSSGSVEAQKLLFSYSNRGDMCTLFSGHFDTKIGSKREAASYTRIAQAIDHKPEEILFLTDVIAEADAATAANCKVCVTLRPGNKPLSEIEQKKYTTIYSFDSLLRNDEIPMKRKKIATEENLEIKKGE